MLAKLLRLCLIVMMVGILSACGNGAVNDNPASADPTAVDGEIEKTPGEIKPTPGPTVIAPGELFRASGNGPDTTETFSLDRDMRIRVSWKQTSAELFHLELVRIDPDPNQSLPERVIFEDEYGPSESFGVFDYFAGEYYFDITLSDSDWEVWVEEVITEG